MKIESVQSFPTRFMAFCAMLDPPSTPMAILVCSNGTNIPSYLLMGLYWHIIT